MDRERRLFSVADFVLRLNTFEISPEDYIRVIQQPRLTPDNTEEREEEGEEEKVERCRQAFSPLNEGSKV